VKIRAPAKINLTLRVVGQRADGYHLLDTIMLPVSLYDEVQIRKILGETPDGDGDWIRVICDDPLVPDGGKNLAYRAAALLLKKARRRDRIEIRIHKNIPVGAGLGGGSTDAAAVLVGLNRLLKLGYSARQLEKISVAIGADVPFFIQARPARARGIGDRLSRLHGVPRWWLIILYPRFAVSTPWVYRNLSPKLTKPIVNTSIAAPLRNLEKLGKLLINDLETVTFKRYPRIKVLKSRLKCTGAVAALMSGSGSAVFGIFGSRREAEIAFRQLRQEEGARAFLTRVLS
jgi:4-diphosphocytidyl-2-C-methyl-D-erythritol kinase